MSAVTFQDQVIVRKHIYDYLEANGMTSLRKIAAYVKQESGLEPTPSTIARLIREYGYDYSGEEWKKQK